MPVGPYETFDACVVAMQGKGHDEESARRICGEMEKETHMADFNNQWIEIFKVGDYGDKGRYTSADLDAMVSNLTSWKPPLVLGHPEHDSPAMGWAAELKRDGDRLLMRAEKVQPQLEGHVKDGRFPNRSVAIYRDPKGTGPAVRHVGFLGANPPEVKGLTPVKFSDGEFVAIDFSDSPAGEKEDEVDLKEVGKTVDERIRAFFSEMFGAKKADAGFTEKELQERVEAAQKPLLEKLDKLTKTFEESVKQSNERAARTEADARLVRFDERVKALTTAGKIVPAMAGTIQLMRERVAQGGTIKFTEGAGKDAKEAELPVLDYALRQLDALPQIVPLGELAGGQHQATGNVLEFTPAKNFEVDQASVAINARAEQIAGELRKQDPKKTELQAFKEGLVKARREIGSATTKIGGIAAGQV